MASIAIKNETLRRSFVRVIIGPSIDRVYGSRLPASARKTGHHRLREGRELHPLLAKLVDLAHDLVDGSLAAIEHGTQLDRGSLHNFHGHLLISVRLTTRWRRSARRWGCRRTSRAVGGRIAAASGVAGNSPRHAGSARRRYG